jgi:hydrogenase-4 component F
MHYPVQGSLWLAGAVAITGAPPFGLFLSELIILRAGIERDYRWAVYAMVVLLIVIFIGFLNHFREMYFGAAPEADIRPQPVSRWCVTPMWLALAPLLLFGLWWPQDMWNHFATIARVLGSPPS